MDIEKFKAFEHDFWNVTGSAYDSAFGHVTSQAIPHLVEHINAKAGDNVLDVACGPGYVTGLCQSRDIKVTGIDFSSAMIDLAKKMFPTSAFHVGDAENISFSDNSFDGVTCNFGMLHFADPDKALGEFYRVCRQGARMAFAVWNTLDQSPAMRYLIEAIEKHGHTKPDLPEGVPFFYYADQDNSFAALEKSGFKNPEHKVLQKIWAIRSAKDMVDYTKNGGARIGATLRAQSDGDYANIIEAVQKKIEAHEQKNGAYQVPVSMVIVSGQK